MRRIVLKSITKIAKTIEEAKAAALQELGVKENQVQIEVLEEPSKGLFGIIGSKDAVIRVVLEDTYPEKTKAFLEDIVSKMGVDAKVEYFEDEDGLHLEIAHVDEKSAGILIGKRGETLDSLQYLANIIANQYSDHYIRVLLDTQSYREKREASLRALAKKMAQKAKRYGRNMKLEPMNPYERRIMHSELQNVEGVSSYSEGKEPYRRLIIQVDRNQTKPSL